jgi:hypothetical protein
MLRYRLLILKALLLRYLAEDKLGLSAQELLMVLKPI